MCYFHGRFLAAPPRSQGIGQVQGLNVGQMVEIVKNTAGFIWSHMENIWKIWWNYVFPVLGNTGFVKCYSLNTCASKSSRTSGTGGLAHLHLSIRTGQKPNRCSLIFPDTSWVLLGNWAVSTLRCWGSKVGTKGHFTSKKESRWGWMDDFNRDFTHRFCGDFNKLQA